MTADQWVANRYPTPSARKAADIAVDGLSDDEPMRVYLDAWTAAYVAASGSVRQSDGKAWEP